MFIKFFLSIFFLTLISCGNSGGGSGNGGIDNASKVGCYTDEYGDPSESDYILPYQIGEEREVSNGNCGRFFTHFPCDGSACTDLRYAYDFVMPTGTPIVAARAGTVIDAFEDQPDGPGGGGRGNYIYIEHEDGSVARYLHLARRSVFVELQEPILQGQIIANSGFTGLVGTIEHLHFDVIGCGNLFAFPCTSIPITFRNAQPLDRPPIERGIYQALSY